MSDNNYLFEDLDTGYIFYVNTEYFEDAERIANDVARIKARYICLHDNYTAEVTGFDTY